MNFRQRLAWLLLFIYLILTGWLVYYIFDVSEHYSKLALNHLQNAHGQEITPSIWQSNIMSHFMDVPFVVWFLLGALPYIQGFCLLYACTRPEPRIYCLSCFVPVIGVFHMYRKKSKACTEENSSNGLLGSIGTNGHISIA